MRQNLFKKIILSSFLVVSSLFVFTQKVSAQSFLPDPIQNLFRLLGPGGEGSAEFVQSRVSALLLIFLGVIILAAVLYTALAAFRYIQSRGDEGEVAEARKGIEAIFQGIAIMLIAIVGIVLIFVFFGAELFAPSLYQTCVSAANSPGCNACTATDGGLPENWDDIKFNSTGVNPGNVNGTSQQICTFCEFLYFTISRDVPGISTGLRTSLNNPSDPTYAKCRE